MCRDQKEAQFASFTSVESSFLICQRFTPCQLSASLHFSGHTFNISSCLNVAANVNVDRISTEIKAYPKCIGGGLGAAAPKTLEPNEYIDCRSLQQI